MRHISTTKEAADFVDETNNLTYTASTFVLDLRPDGMHVLAGGNKALRTAVTFSTREVTVSVPPSDPDDPEYDRVSLEELVTFFIYNNARYK